MEAAGSTKQGSIYRTIKLHIPEDHNLNTKQYNYNLQVSLAIPYRLKQFDWKWHDYHKLWDFEI